MFNTLRHSDLAGGLYVLERASPPFDKKGPGKPARIACMSCRARKLKCSGEQHGCQRCLAKKVECTYPSTPHPRSSSSSSQTGARATDTAATDPRAGEHPVPTTTTHVDTRHDTVEPVLAVGEMPRRRVEPTASDDIGDDFGLPDLDASFDMSTLLDTETPYSWTTMAGDDLGRLANQPAAYNASRNHHHDHRHQHLYGDDTFIFSIDTDTDGSRSDPTSSFFSPVRSSSEATPQSLTPSIDVPITPLGSSTDRMLMTPTEASVLTYYDNAPEPASSNQCPCFGQAVETYESIEVHLVWGPVPPAGLDELLRHQKDALASCETLLDCPACNTRSHYIMLVISMCAKIMASIENMCLAAADEAPLRIRPTNSSPSSSTSRGSGRRPSKNASQPQPSHHHYRQNPHHHRHSRPHRHNSHKDRRSGLSVGRWKLDEEDELHVLQGLLSARVAKLGAVVGRLERGLDLGRWPAHEAMIRDLRERLAGALHAVRKMPSW